MSKSDLVQEIRDRLATLDPGNLDPGQARSTVLALRQLAEHNQHESTSALALADLIESTHSEPVTSLPEGADPRSVTLRTGKDWVVINARLSDGRRATLTGMVTRLHDTHGQAPRHKTHTGVELHEATLRVTEAAPSAEPCT